MPIRENTKRLNARRMAARRLQPCCSGSRTAIGAVDRRDEHRGLVSQHYRVRDISHPGVLIVVLYVTLLGTFSVTPYGSLTFTVFYGILDVQGP